MWRRPLDQRFARRRPRPPVASRRAFPRRSPLLFEPLESRLLLSADLLPVDGVLEVVGTADDDSLLIRQLDPEAGAAARISVTLNGESFEFAAADVSAIHVDLLGGDDQVTVDEWATAPPVSGPADDIVVGAASLASHVKAFDGASGELLRSFFAFPGFTGGVNVAAGDVNGDGTDDIIAGAASSDSHVVAFDGATGELIRSFFAFPGFTGGVSVAAGDIDGDGSDDIIVGAGAGAPGGHIKVYSGTSGELLQSFLAFGGFTGGVSVAAGDVNGDGTEDIIAAAGAGAPDGHVKAFDGTTGELIRSFFAFPGFAGGVSIAAGDIDGDGRDDIIVGASAGAPGGHLKAFSGQSGELLQSFFAFPGFTGGVAVASGDVTGDGRDDIIAGAGTGAPGGTVEVFDGVSGTLALDFFVFPGFTGGVTVAAGDLNPDRVTPPAPIDLTIEGGDGNDALTVNGTDGDDAFTLLDGAVEREGSGSIAFTGLEAVAVNARGGADQVQGRMLLDADWNVQLGDGNDVADLKTLIGDQFSEARYRVDAGEGDNQVALRFGDGEHGARPPSDSTRVTVEYRSGAGRDSVEFDWLAHVDRPLEVSLDVSTGAGDDVVVANWEQQFEFRPGKTARMDYNFELGEGDDALALRLAPGEGVEALGAQVQVTSVDKFGRVKVAFPFDESTRGEADVAGVESLHLETGSGDDRVTVDDATGGLGAIRFDVATGAGDDEVAVKYNLFLSDGTPVRAKVALGVLTGEGDDSVGVEVLGGTDLAIDIDTQGGDDTVFADFHDGTSNTILFGEVRGGAGNDFLDVSVSGESGGMGLVVDGGAGDDAMMFNPSQITITKDVNWAARLDGGEGNDLIAHELGHIVQQAGGADEPAPLRLSIDAGSGDDRIFGQFADVSAAIDYEVSAGGGADQVLVGLLLPAVQSPREAAARLGLDLGGGDDVAALDIDTGDLGAGINPCTFVAVDAGLGRDRVSVAARGAFEDFGLAADLGADAGGNEVAIEELTLVFEEIRLEYQVQASHRYAYAGGASAAGAKAAYGFGLTSDGEQAQVRYGADTVAGNVADQVDVAVGGAQEQTVGSLQTVTVSDRGAEFTQVETLTVRGNRTEDVALDTRVEIGGLDNASMTNAVNTAVGGGAQRIALANARAGNEWGGSSLDISTGDGDDEVLVGLLLPAVQKAREAAIRVDVDLGDGNDSLGLDLSYPAATQAAEIASRIAVDAGAGDDSVVATYDFFEAWPSKWKGSTLEVATGDGNDFASLGFAGLPRDSGAPDAAAEPAEFAFDLGAGEDTLQVDAFSGTDAPVRIAFANVTGLGSEVSAVDYRAGAEIDGRFAGQVDMTGVEAVRLGTGAGDDSIDIDLDHPRVPPPKLAFVAGAGDDAIVASLEGVTGGAALSLDLGTGSDRVAVTWKGPPPHGDTDPLLLDIALGGADTDAFFGPELDDEVLVTFVSGDSDRPYIVGTVWNSEDVPQQGVKSLHVELSGAGSRTRISSVLTGGAGSDEVQVSVQGEQGPLFGLQLNAVFDLGAGDDCVQIDLSRLEIEGPTRLAPLSVELLGGAGEDALRVTGTGGADRITVSGREVRLAGLAYIGYQGLESLYVDAGDGDDVVILTAQNPGPPTVTLDGGPGRDRFVARFDPGFFEPTLLNFERTRTGGFTF